MQTTVTATIIAQNSYIKNQLSLNSFESTSASKLRAASKNNGPEISSTGNTTPNSLSLL